MGHEQGIGSTDKVEPSDFTEACKDYFKPSKLWHGRHIFQQALAVAAVISYATLVIPILMRLILFCSETYDSLYGRVHKNSPNENSPNNDQSPDIDFECNKENIPAGVASIEKDKDKALQQFYKIINIPTKRQNQQQVNSEFEDKPEVYPNFLQHGNLFREQPAHQAGPIITPALPLTQPIAQPPSDIHERLKKQISIGAERLKVNKERLRQGKSVTFHMNEHNFFAHEVFNKPGVQLEFVIPEGEGHIDKYGKLVGGTLATRYMLPPNDPSVLPTTMIAGLYFFPEQTKAVVEEFRQENIRRANHMPPLPFIKKLFVPFVAAGGVNHAITAVVELHPPDSSKPNTLDPNQVKISIINPMGAGGYRPAANALANNIQSVFPKSRVVHNQVPQQTDPYYCGFHQILNIKLLMEEPDVFKYISEGKLELRPVKKLKELLEI